MSNNYNKRMVAKKELLNRIKERILRFDSQAHVYLFGSRSKGSADKNSDWDILILLETDQIRQTETKINDELYELELETGEVINPLVYSQEEWHNKYCVTPFYTNVMEENIRL